MTDQPVIERIDFDEMLDRIMDPDMRVGLADNAELWFELDNGRTIVRTLNQSPGRADVEGTGPVITEREQVADLLNGLVEDGESFTTSVIHDKSRFKFNWAITEK